MTITNDVLKFRKAIEFKNSCIESYIYLIIDGQRSFINKKVAKKLKISEINKKLKLWARVPIIVSSSPSSSSRKKGRVKTKKIRNIQ